MSPDFNYNPRLARPLVKYDSKGLLFANFLNPNGLNRAVVFLHGYTGSRKEWANHVEPLIERNHKVLVVDLFGHNDSSLSDSSQRDYLFNNANCVAGLLADHKIKRPHFVAHSMGALVFLEYAKLTIGTGLFPASCVLVSPELGDPRYLGPGGLLKGSSFIARTRLTRFDRLANEGKMDTADASLDATIRLFQALGPATMKTFGATDAAVSEFSAYLVRLRNLDPNARRIILQAQIQRGAELRAQLTCKEIRLPKLLVLGGSVDLLIDAKKVGTILNESGAEYEQLVVPRAGHFLHYEQPVIFNALLSEFLRSI